MKPKVQIRKIAECYFNYAVSNGDGDDLYSRDGLASIAECLHDAATALGIEFKTITISYDGVVLGDYSVPAMEHDTLLLANKLRAQLSAAVCGT
jgi:hypothetical protein